MKKLIIILTLLFVVSAYSDITITITEARWLELRQSLSTDSLISVWDQLRDPEYDNGYVEWNGLGSEYRKYIIDGYVLLANISKYGYGLKLNNIGVRQPSDTTKMKMYWPVNDGWLTFDGDTLTVPPGVLKNKLTEFKTNIEQRDR
jgi:hypothetical protein